MFKIFLTASPEERASRRYKQLKQKGINVSLPDVLQKITQRDKRDVNRKVAPLKAASDAQIFDSTGAAPEDTADKILDSLKILGIPSAN